MNASDRSETAHLIGELVAAFPVYIERRLGELGVRADAAVADAVAAAAAALEAGLRELLGQPSAQQARSPLELIRDATRPVTDALASLAVPVPERDDWEQSQHPEDVYQLYPASSQDLGEDAWRLHLQWGMDKAKAVAGVVPDTTLEDRSPRLPAVALFGLPLEERQPVVDFITERGYRALLWRNPAALAEVAVERPLLAIVDLRHPSARSAISTLAGDGIKCVAVADYVDDLIAPGLLALGAAEVIELTRLAGRLDGLLPRLV